VKLGVDRETFAKLLNVLSDQLEALHGNRVQASQGQELLLSSENMLALVLNWITEYRSVRSLSIDFGVSANTIKSYLPLLVDMLYEVLKKFVSPPPRIQSKVSQGPLAGTCLFVDSFPVPLESRPDFGKKESRARSQYYWFAGGKANKWAIKVQVTLGLNGKIWDISKAVPYATSDQKLFQESAVPGILNRNNTLRGIGDLHYSKQHQFIPKVRNPKTSTLKRRNKAIEKVRASIEHTIGRLKNYRILKGPYRGNRENLVLVEKVATTVAGIINMEIKEHPIQADLRKWKRQKTD